LGGRKKEQEKPDNQRIPKTRMERILENTVNLRDKGGLEKSEGSKKICKLPTYVGG